MIGLSEISKEEAARYMGVVGRADPQLERLLEDAEKMVLECIRPQYVCRELSISECDEGIALEGTPVIMRGNDIRKHLSGCGRAVLLAVTLSAEADKLIRRTAVSDMALSLAVDSLCSAAVEQVCDRAEEEIFAKLSAPYRTWRFSPGYGDLPLELQSDFLAALNAQRRIGLTATENSLLIPSKSVTAVIGLSDTPVTSGARGCALCSMRESCAYRQAGSSCSQMYKK